MIAPQTPANEAARLQALASYNIVDTLPEQDYDDITALAAFICDTPIAMVSLIDQTRQVFKSKVGLEADSTPRDHAFCAHAINEPEQMMVVPDARDDQRFRDNPLVTEEPHVVFYAGAPLVTPDGYALGTLCVIDQKPRQLTAEQKRALDALSRQVMNLMEARKQHAELKEVYRRLEDTNQELREFAHRASHDLREPLRNITTFMGMLQQKYGSQFDEKANKYIDIAQKGAKRLEQLVNDLIEYARTTREEQQAEDIDVNQLMEEVMDLLATGRDSDGKPRVHFQPLPTIWSYKVPVKQLFQNLIGNALKYHAPDQEPYVEVSCREDGPHWHFSVADKGIGIDPKYFDMIFEPFRRLHSEETYTGTGLGLATCKKIVQVLKGTIWVESEPKKGTTFHFTIQKDKLDSPL